MKTIHRICFVSALWLLVIPGLCMGSPEPESVLPTCSGDANFLTAAAESSEPPSKTEPSSSPDSAEETASADQKDTDDAFSTVPAPSQTDQPAATVADPLEPINRAFFNFNDKLYFWILKPVATGYKAVIPEDGRIGIRNFFYNVKTPVRLVNCLLQARFKGAGNETIRFAVNTTIGVAGFFDPAKKRFHIERQDADFGQTLGIWGMGPVIYFNWPLLGPSTVRDTAGYVTDLFFDPRTYLAYYYFVAEMVNVGTSALDRVNETSLTLGEYENLKKAALDPYIALREAYIQYRQNKIKR